MKVLLIIPARYGSTRFEGKPLALLGGVPIIERVYRRAKSVTDNVIVATDDERIAAVVKGFGGVCAMTSSEHRSGTDRCCQAWQECGVDADIVINIQGDEPFIERSEIETLIECMRDNSVDIATLATPFLRGCSIEDIENPNSVKVVTSQSNSALYFSRSAVPYLRGVDRDRWSEEHTFYRHVGVYAFRAKILEKVTQIEQTPLEKMESLEQLRWLESGYKISVGFTQGNSIGIDTPEDLARAEEYLSTIKNNY
ncbi:MAG: 3-deoxy-manno-octulosonate cytidylyltransferase [Rikenellaceae bacterium]